VNVCWDTVAQAYVFFSFQFDTFPVALTFSTLHVFKFFVPSSSPLIYETPLNKSAGLKNLYQECFSMRVSCQITQGDQSTDGEGSRSFLYMQMFETEDTSHFHPAAPLHQLL